MEVRRSDDILTFRVTMSSTELALLKEDIEQMRADINITTIVTVMELMRQLTTEGERIK